MRFTFVTHGDIQTLATVKRATGMAGPLCKAGHDVSIVIQDEPANRERISFECPEATPLYFKHGSVYSQVSQKRQLLQQSNPDVVWVCAVGARNWVSSLFRSKRPIMLMEHSELLSNVPQFSRIRRLRECLMEWSTLFWFDGLVCASRYLEKLYDRRLKLFGKKSNILYSPYAYNSDVIHMPPTKLGGFKQRYAGKKVIFYVGRLMACYGIFEIINAVAELKKKRQDFVLLVAGSGPEKARAVEAVGQQNLSDVIEMLGYVPEEDLPSYFHLANAFLCPMRDTVQDWARCPSKLFMYLPFAKPIVTCRIGEAPELLAYDGFYFEPENVASLSATLERALSVGGDWRPAISARSHSWETRADQLVSWVSNNWGR